LVEDRLFATLDTVTREVDVGGGYRVRLTDTVGFIRKLPHHLVASFRATLEETSEADLLLHVIDASHAAWEDQAEVVDQELLRNDEGGRGTGEEGRVLLERKRVIYVFNKADLLQDAHAFLERARERFPHAVMTSVAPDRLRPSLTDVGVEGLRTALRTSAQALRPVAEVRVPVGDGKLLALLHRDAEVMGQHQVDGVVVVTARVEAILLGRLRREGVGVEILG
jgi:GTP-binding protein HflX